MKNRKNISLFWYGFFAGLKIFGGIILTIIGFVLGIFFGLLSKSLLVFFIVIILFSVGGITLIFKGKSQRFDYQRQSGYIVHRGDF